MVMVLAAGIGVPPVCCRHRGGKDFGASSKQTQVIFPSDKICLVGRGECCKCFPCGRLEKMVVSNGKFVNAGAVQKADQVQALTEEEVSCHGQQRNIQCKSMKQWNLVLLLLMLIVSCLCCSWCS